MILYATDFDRTKRVVIDAYSHVNWEPSFDDEGTFEMVVPKEVAKKISHDMVIENSEDPFNQAYVQYNDFDTNEGIDSYVTIKGYFLNIKLRERVCLGEFEFEEDTLENVMSMLLQTSVATPRDFGRNLNIIYSSEDLKGLTLSFENNYNDLFDNIKKVCQQLDLGFKLMLEQDCSFSLHIYDGLDLSNEVKLSMELDTSTAMMYFKDSSGEANVVYVMGDDETIVEEVVLESKEKKAERKETFLSVSDVKRGDLSESAYRAILRSKVLEMKESFKATVSVESSLTPQNRIQYGEHFLIGDIITQEFKDFGVESVSRVTGVSQMWSIDGYTVAIISSNVKKRRR